MANTRCTGQGLPGAGMHKAARFGLLMPGCTFALKTAQWFMIFGHAKACGTLGCMGLVAWFSDLQPCEMHGMRTAQGLCGGGLERAVRCMAGGCTLAKGENRTFRFMITLDLFFAAHAVACAVPLSAITT